MEKNIKYEVINASYNHVIYNGVPLTNYANLDLKTLNFIESVTKHVITTLNHNTAKVWEYLAKVTNNKNITTLQIPLRDILQIFINISDVNAFYHFRFCNDVFVNMLLDIERKSFMDMDKLQQIALHQAEERVYNLDIIPFILEYFFDLYELPELKNNYNYSNLCAKLRKVGSISLGDENGEFTNYCMCTLCESDHGADLIFNFSDL